MIALAYSVGEKEYCAILSSDNKRKGIVQESAPQGSQRTTGPDEKGLSPWEPRPTGTSISGTNGIRRCTMDYLLRLACAVTIEAVLALAAPRPASPSLPPASAPMQASAAGCTWRPHAGPLPRPSASRNSSALFWI